MKILELEINEVRGIKHLKIQPDGENVVVFGHNGTGKSGIIDAVDFLLTGKISRLTGDGTKCLSQKEHGCHIDVREDLKKAVVKAKVKIEDKEIELERCFKNPNNLKVSPCGEESTVADFLKVAELGQHVLSRREILKFITAESGKRAKEIMSLLDLTNIDNIRSNLVTIKNTADQNFKLISGSFEVAKSEIVNLLSMQAFTEKEVLEKINELRAILGGPKIDVIDPDQFKENLQPQHAGNKEEMLTVDQIKNTAESLTKFFEDDNLKQQQEELRKQLEDVLKEAKLKQYSIYKKLFETGIILVDENNVCPLCGQTFDGDLKGYILGKSKETEVAKEKQENIDKVSTEVSNQLKIFKNNIANAVKAHRQFELNEFKKEEVDGYLALLDEWIDRIQSPLESYEKQQWTKEQFMSLFNSKLVKEQIANPLNNEISKIGEKINNQQIAWDNLTKLEVQWGNYIKSFTSKNQAEIFQTRSVNALDYFEKARDSVLESLYDNVNKHFIEYYKQIHASDEGNFKSKISHNKSELNIEVDFYGRGLFPPHALHSEGHQDSMGLCLFFSLNKYLTNNLLKIIILDDVVMSIDRNHRRDICNLLKKFFPDTQFIITTHETAWAKQLKTEGIVTKKNMLHFLNWNIKSGPIFELGKDLWDKIAEDLSKNDVASAAHKLRHSAESFFEDICDLLSAKITYKGNYRWELGDFAPSAISIFKKDIKLAKSNLQKQGDGMKDKLGDLEKFEESSKEIISKSAIEQWIINENVHYNKWDEFAKKDFEPVVVAFKDLFSLFSCDKCGATISLSIDKGEPPKSTVSCNCGNIFWNVTK